SRQAESDGKDGALRAQRSLPDCVVRCVGRGHRRSGDGAASGLTTPARTAAFHRDDPVSPTVPGVPSPDTRGRCDFPSRVLDSRLPAGSMSQEQSITVEVPGPLRATCGGAARVAVPARTLRDLLEALERLYPELHRSVCHETGKVRP